MSFEYAERVSNVYLGTVTGSSTDVTIFSASPESNGAQIRNIQLTLGNSYSLSDSSYLTFKVTKTGTDGTGTTKIVDETVLANTTKLNGTAISANVPINLTLVANPSFIDSLESLKLTIAKVGVTAQPEIWNIACVADVAPRATIWDIDCLADVVLQPTIWDIDCVADVLTAATPTVWTIGTVADVADSLDGKTFILEDDAGTVGFWIDTDDSGTTIPAEASACNRAVEVTTIATNDTAATIAGLLETAIHADSKFSSSSVSNITTVISSTNNNYAAASASTSGFEVNVSDAGNIASNTLDAAYFLLEDDVGTVGFWIDIDDSGTTIPAGASAADRAVEITTIASNDTAATIAGLLETAIHADSKFTASSASITTTVTSSTNKSYSSDAGDTGFTITATQIGIDSAVLLDGTYFLLEDDVGTVGFWIDTDDSGTTAPAGASAADRAVEITTISSGDSASQVAAKLETAIHADSKFSASSASITTTVTSSTTANYTQAADGDTGFTIAVTQTGISTSASLDGTYFLLEDDSGTVSFWIDVDNSGTAEPAGSIAADRSVEVTTISSNDTAATIAGLLETAIHADSKFSASSASINTTVTSSTNDNYTGVDGDTGFTITSTQTGTAGVAVPADLTRVLNSVKYRGDL